MHKTFSEKNAISSYLIFNTTNATSKTLILSPNSFRHPQHAQAYQFTNRNSNTFPLIIGEHTVEC